MVRLNAMVLESAFTIVEADPDESVTTPSPMSSLFVPSSAARAIGNLGRGCVDASRGVRGVQPVQDRANQSGMVGFDRQNASRRIEVVLEW